MQNIEITDAIDKMVIVFEEKLTKSIQEIDEKLKKLRNYDSGFIFDYEEYPAIEGEVIRIEKRDNYSNR